MTNFNECEKVHGDPLGFLRDVSRQSTEYWAALDGGSDSAADGLPDASRVASTLALASAEVRARFLALESGVQG